MSFIDTPTSILIPFTIHHRLRLDLQKNTNHRQKIHKQYDIKYQIYIQNQLINCYIFHLLNFAFFQFESDRWRAFKFYLMLLYLFNVQYLYASLDFVFYKTSSYPFQASFFYMAGLCLFVPIITLLIIEFFQYIFLILKRKIKECFNIQLFRPNSTMRPMTVKQAQKWLEKLKNMNQNSFKELAKTLRKYEKNSDDHECFIKVNNLLLQHPDMTLQINGFLEDGNKLVVHQSEVQKINDLVKYIRKVDIHSFNQIASFITKLHSDRRNQPNSQLNEDQQNKLVRNFVLNQVRGKPELEAYAQKALFMSPQEMIQELDLSYLKNTKPQEAPAKIQSEEPLQVPYQPPVQREQPNHEYLQKPKIKTYPPFINQNEQKIFFRHFQAIVDPKIYENILKIIHIYHLGIISRTEALDLLKPHCGSDFAAVKDLIESRQTDRRRNCNFRPLNDMDFLNFQRATHSYVKMPELYPHYCSHNNAFLKQILNKKWVSVPRGSQETFNVRIKNSYEQNLIKAEDDRYQFDIYCKRLEKGLQILERAINKLKQKIDSDISKEIETFISLGSIQTMYKNTSKEQRQELQFHLRSIKFDTLVMFHTRMKAQYDDLVQMRSIHGVRTWGQIANKNFQKALDFKGHEFKRTQKLKMKAGVFQEQLKVRINYLNSKGENKSYDTPFEDKKQFFSILNSFETSSRKERCLHRKLPTPKIYNIKQHKIPSLLPAMILAFEDQTVMTMVYSYMSFYLENAVANQAERIRCKATFKQIMSRFFKQNKFQCRALSQNFEQEKFFNEIGSDDITVEKIDDWTHFQVEDEYQTSSLVQQIDKIPVFNSYHDKPSEFNFEPPKSDKNLVFYAADNFYVFVRLFYAFYERIVRMRQVAETERKSRLFQILYFACIKTKQSARFEDSLNSLFGEHAYLFSTFYKLLESLQKSLNTVSICPFYNYSEKLMNYSSQQIYLMLLNRFILNNSMTSSRLMRYTYEQESKILYINSFDSYYRIDDQIKQLQKRRADITSKIQIYTLLKSDEAEARQMPDVVTRNEMQYCFEGNSIKMINLSSKQDFMIGNRRDQKAENLLIELKRNKKLRERII